MSVTWVAIPTSAMPVISPRPAVISGIPAAISEPNVSSRMTSAATTPTAVAGPMLKPSAFSITCPPAASFSPGTWIVVDRVEHRLTGLVGQQVGALVVVDRRERGLADRARPRPAGGAVWADHAVDMRHRVAPGPAAARSRRARPARRRSRCEVWKTIVSMSPLWALNWLLSRSVTCWASVPGRLKSVAYWRPTAGCDHGRQNCDRNPTADDPPSMGDAPSGQADHRFTVTSRPRGSRDLSADLTRW